jgi:folate-binding protein YgfZ
MFSGYQEARERAAFDERIDRGRVLLSGPGGKAFLHALVTNDIAALAPGSGCYAALLNPQGRMITDMDVLCGAADAILLVVPSDAAAPLAARLDRLIFAEEVVPADVSASTAHFSVTGPASGEVVDAAVAALGYGPVAARLDVEYHNVHLSGINEDGLVWRTHELGLDGIDIAVGRDHAPAVRAQLASLAAPLSREARETLRVEAGRPEFHVDMTAETIPLEANLLDRAISTTKGCYVGQEVIIRVLHRGGGRVAKRLVQLQFDGGEARVPSAGTALSADGREMGRVTSAVWSPRTGAAIGLGYVHRDFVREGLELAMPDGRRAVITSV